MSIISFFKEAGERLFGHKDAEAAAKQAQAAPDNAALQAQAQQANQTAATAITNYIKTQNLPVDGLDVTFDNTNDSITIANITTDQTTKKKIVLCYDNINNVDKINDMMTIKKPTDESH